MNTAVGVSLDVKLLSHKQVGPACFHMFKNCVIIVQVPVAHQCWGFDLIIAAALTH